MGAKDEIVFASSMFSSGTPTINLSSTPITITEPVLIHSPLGSVRIVASSTPLVALFLQPSRDGIGEDFEIRDLVFEDFTYAVRVLSDTVTADPDDIEGVNVIDNTFVNNERAIFFENARVPFEVSDNQIIGRDIPASPPDAGIWIADSSLAPSNTFSALIDNNYIDDHDDIGVYVNAKVQNLVISNNNIGTLGGNGAGIYIEDAEMQNGAILGNEIFNNFIGIAIDESDGIEISGNDISDNDDIGIRLQFEANDHQIVDNEFYDNGGSAIVIGSGTTDNSIGNRVSDNHFVGNGELPIDLGNNNAIEVNDSNDADSGPNRRLNHPVFVEGSIVDEGDRWVVPIDLDITLDSPYRFEFYRYIAATEEYVFIRAETLTLTGTAGNELNDEPFYFVHGTELNSGERLAVLVIDDDTGDTSELVTTTNALIDVLPPTVENVIISSTVANAYGTNPPYEFDDVVGDGDQLLTVPVGGANRIAVQFSEDVDIESPDLEFIALNRVVSEPSIVGFDEPSIANDYTATWTLAFALPSAIYLLRLADSIEDLAGNALDGEWTNPASYLTTTATKIFPSGDETAGGDFEFVFTILGADANRDLLVEFIDFTAMVAHYGQSAMNFANGDFDGDGTVDFPDFTRLVQNYGLDFRTFVILGDYENDFFVLDEADEDEFLSLYSTSNSAADLNGDGNVTTADFDAFYALFNFGIDLAVLS
ncbi:MAG: right-handed parallel beta-helix repeat-containing protein [Pirellulales bacterium]